MKHYSIAFVFLLIGCSEAVTGVNHPNSAQTNTFQNIANNSMTEQLPKLTSDDFAHKLRNSSGLLKTTDKAIKAGKIDVYNNDGSHWYAFRFIENPKSNETVNKDFKPFLYSVDGYVVFNLVAQNEKYFEVIANEETGLKKYILKTDKAFERQTWEAHILDSFAIGFNKNSNPLKNTPDGEVIKDESLGSESTYYPSEIKGDWLKVKWFENNDEKKPENSGWIRWKENDVMIIGLFTS